MLPRWRLLGSQEAGCGTLAFGWSTAAIVRRRTERSTEGFATLRERFATWIAVSNRNRCLGLALTLLYAIRRGQCHIVLDLAEEMMDGSSDRAGDR